jgi:nucleotide-binding universal stress UspA family protein
VGLVTREMTQMAEFILLQAQLRAQSVGVDAEGTIRRGTVQEEILACCRDMAADILILGKPAEAHGENIFTTAWLESFSQRVKAECGTRVIVVKGKESL